MNPSTFRRLASDHAALHKAELPPYYLHASGSSSMPDDLTQLTILLAGPPGTPYANGVWKLYLKMPLDYPKSPPKASFRTKIWHPNVEEGTGSVCLETLKRDWESKLTLRDILITISCLLIHPNPDSALNSEAGKLLQEAYEEFARKARLMTSIHAKVPASLQNAVNDARSRGEEKPKNAIVEQAPVTSIAEDSDADDEEDEASASKENDPSLSPSPLSTHPPASAYPRRPTILGKRPLSDLPTPVEPPSDDEGDSALTASERNIVANTPNLSSSFASFTFSSTSTCTSSPTFTSTSNTNTTPSSKPITTTTHRRSPKLTERNQPFNFPPSHHRSESSASVLSASIVAAASCTPDSTTTTQEPSAKRRCSDEGKENFGSENAIFAATAQQPKPTPLVGLGAKTLAKREASGNSGSRKGSAASVGSTGSKGGNGKARVGVRRL